MENLKKQTGTLSFVPEDVFNEIIRRVIERLRLKTPSLPLLKDERYYKILSECFLQGYEYDLEDLESTLCFDSEENDRKIDEWLAFKKVYYELKGRPNHSFNQILRDDDKVWIDLFKDRVSPQDAAMVIDLIQSVRPLGKGRTKIEIAKLLEYNWDIKVGNEHYHNEQNTNVNAGEAVEDERGITGQAGDEKKQEKKKSGPKKNRRSFQELIHVEDNNERWENIKKILQKLFEDYRLSKERAQILWILCKMMKREKEDLPSSEELAEAYEKASFSELICRSTFKQNQFAAIDDNFKKEIERQLFKVCDKVS
ncbi:hypothetical protein [Bacteroides sp.]|uniref:hypothetical protein n=1 Tax=Bacteroides sp. TaxID=29523 RepID=UPI002605AABF|nr:hypothetical protein [Bacteroides sp.]